MAGVVRGLGRVLRSLPPEGNRRKSRISLIGRGSRHRPGLGLRGVACFWRIRLSCGALPRLGHATLAPTYSRAQRFTASLRGPRARANRNYAKAVLLPALAGAGPLRRLKFLLPSAPPRSRPPRASSATRAGPIRRPSSPTPRSRASSSRRATTAAAPRSRSARSARGRPLVRETRLPYPDEVDRVAAVARETGGFLIVGYNRRFSPHSRAIREAFAGRSVPLSLH